MNTVNWTIFWWELLGTAIFAHGICASNGEDWYTTMALFLAIFIVGPFSGGHVNPAVSFGFWTFGGMSLGELFTRAIA